MDIKRFEEFTVYAKYLNMQAAADELFISQSTLSTHIAELEQELGFRLIARSKPSRLTGAGEYFLAQAQKITQLYQKSVSTGRSLFNASSRIRIHNQSITFDLMPLIREASAESRERYGHDVQYSLENVTGQIVIDALNSGSIDIGFLYGAENQSAIRKSLREKGVACIPLPKTPVSLYVQKGHPLAERDFATYEQLLDFPFSFPAKASEETWIRAVQEALYLAAQIRISFDVVAIDTTYGWSSHDFEESIVALSNHAAAALRSIGQFDKFIELHVEGKQLAIAPYLAFRLNEENMFVVEFVRCVRAALKKGYPAK